MVAGRNPILHRAGYHLFDHTYSDISQDQFNKINKDFAQKHKQSFITYNAGDAHVPKNLISSAMADLRYLPFKDKLRKIVAFADHDFDDLISDTLSDLTGTDKKIWERSLKESKPVVMSVNNEAILQHELGHLKDAIRFSKHSSGVKALIFAMRQSPRAFMVAASSKAARDKMKKNPTTKHIADAVEAHPYLSSFLGYNFAKLRSEGYASIHSATELVKNHGMKSGLSKAKVLLPAYATYLTAGMIPSAIIGGKITVDKYLRNNKKEN